MYCKWRVIIWIRKHVEETKVNYCGFARCVAWGNWLKITVIDILENNTWNEKVSRKFSVEKTLNIENLILQEIVSMLKMFKQFYFVLISVGFRITMRTLKNLPHYIPDHNLILWPKLFCNICYVVMGVHLSKELHSLNFQMIYDKKKNIDKLMAIRSNKF